MPEFIGMNFMMAGMAPVMSFLMMGRDMRAMDPAELLFWGVAHHTTNNNVETQGGGGLMMVIAVSE